ncbi:MAG: hypothetical protein WBQ21_01775 [Solirubrobacteraceae bacterium]
MKKIHVVGLAMFAVLAFSAFSVASAFATSLEWLVDGAAVTGAVKTETTGTLLLADLKVPIIGTASIECEGSLDGTVNTAGKDEITEVLTIEKVKVGAPLVEPSLLCTGQEGCEGNSKIWPVGLPWKTQLELSGTTAIDNTTSATKLGYEVECTAFGIKEVDECTQALSAPVLENMLTGSENDLLTTFKEENTGSCTLGGEKSSDITGEGLISDTEGLTLIVSGDEFAE